MMTTTNCPDCGNALRRGPDPVGGPEFRLMWSCDSCKAIHFLFAHPTVWRRNPTRADDEIRRAMEQAYREEQEQKITAARCDVNTEQGKQPDEGE